MKKTAIYFILSAFLLMLAISCNKKEESIAPVASFTLVKNEVLVGQLVEIQNTSENAEYYAWDFGDGNTYPDENPGHFYNESGNYTITLRTINKELEDTYSENIIVKEPAQGTIAITTKSALNVGTTSAYSGGNIFNNSAETIIAKGICWHRFENPSLENNMGSTNEGAGNENFTSAISPLMPSTNYFVRAYITTSNEVIYGNQIEFITKEEVVNYEPKSTDIAYTNTRIIIDGKIDDVWSNYPVNDINRLNADQNVSLGSGAKFKVTWDDDFIYILTIVPDDNFYPHIDASVASWQADRIEVFFDVNGNLKDGNGVEAAGTGHYQASMDYPDPIFFGNDIALVDLNQYSLLVNNDANYIVEYAISFKALIDRNNLPLDPYQRRTIGFDIKVADLDEPGKGKNTDFGAVNWSNNISDNWFNMDDAGTINFIGGTK